MSTRRIQSDASSVSLFPFLAVLLCTMGSLIVILVVLTRQVRATAEPAPPAPPPVAEELAKKVAEERENFEWQIENLEQSLATTAEQLQNDRLKLSNAEEAVNRLKKTIAEYELAARELDKASHLTEEQRQQAADDLARLQHRLTEVANELQRAQREAANRPVSYSIIPYEGPNQTHRRPIFIECTSDAVYLQPEGIRLNPHDFDEPLGPGNPLAAALRATREYLVQSRRAAGLPEQEPYPLIIVRPTGIAAYYGVRDAIKSWDSEFGYELIGEDWKLSFPAADSRLAQIQQQAVDEGRVYQERVAAAAPSMYGRRPVVYRAAPHRGGLIREDGLGGSGGSMGGRSGDPRSGSRGEERFGSGQEQAAQGDRASTHGNNRTSAQQGSAGSRAQQQGGSLAPPSGAQATGSVAGKAEQTTQGFENNGMSRQKNWALPDANNQSVPVTRTVRVLCREDRLVIMPERGLEGGFAIELKENTADSLDEFVSKMWEHMKGWGIAGSGLHWRPVLRLQIMEGGEQRAQDLAVLLTNSGVEVKEAGQP